MDATHPQHNPVLIGGWIKRGKAFAIESNTGRRRLNINGAITIKNLRAAVRFDDTIDAASTIALLQQLAQAFVLTLQFQHALALGIEYPHLAATFALGQPRQGADLRPAPPTACQV